MQNLDESERYRLAVLRIVIQPSWTLMRRRVVESEQAEESKAFAQLLDGTIPINRLKDVYQIAIKRVTSSFAPNAFDLLAVWKEIDDRERAEAAKLAAEEAAKPENRVKNCPNRPYHCESTGWVYVMNPFNHSENVKMPCQTCRTKAYHEKWDKFLDEERRKYGVSIPTPLETVHAHAVHLKLIVPPADFPALEARELARVFNDLVNELNDTDLSRYHQRVSWDEGAQVFRPPHRLDKMFTVDQLRARIETYKTMAEAKRLAQAAKEAV